MELSREGSSTLIDWVVVLRPTRHNNIQPGNGAGLLLQITTTIKTSADLANTAQSKILSSMECNKTYLGHDNHDSRARSDAIWLKSCRKVGKRPPCNSVKQSKLIFHWFYTIQSRHDTHCLEQWRNSYIKEKVLTYSFAMFSSFHSTKQFWPNSLLSNITGKQRHQHTHTTV